MKRRERKGRKDGSEEGGTRAQGGEKEKEEDAEGEAEDDKDISRQEGGRGGRRG